MYINQNYSAFYKGRHKSKAVPKYIKIKITI